MKKIYKLKSKGRGKFKPVSTTKEVILKCIQNIIKEEEKKIKNLKNTLNTKNYDEKKINVLSLFSGCGGFDLGILISGLISIGEDEKKIFLSKDLFEKKLQNNPYKIIYAIDTFKEAVETHKLNLDNSTTYDQNDIRKIKQFPKCDMVVGGFPVNFIIFLKILSVLDSHLLVRD